MSFSLFFQSLINGLNQGAIYALIALGYTMVYGIIRMINFAHGDFIMIGAYTLFYTIPLMVNAGMPAWLAVIVAIAVCAVVGVLVETFAYRPVRKAGPMSALITALAMSIFLENLAMVLFGAKPHNVQAIFSLPTVIVGGVALPLNVLLTIAIGLGMMIALQLFVKKTKLGKAMRAVPQDKDASTLVGINVNKIITTTFAMTAFDHALIRGCKRDVPFFTMESTPSLVNWHEYNKLKRPGVNRLQGLQTVACGGDGVQYFQWRKGRGGTEQWHGAVVDHDGRDDTRVFKDVTETNAALNALTPVIGSLPRAEAALIFDWDSRWALEDAWGMQIQQKNLRETVCALHEQLGRCGVDADVIGVEESLDRYKVVVLPMLYMVKPGFGEKIRQFVANGGTVIGTYLLGYVNDSTLAWLGGFPGDGLREVFGVTATELDTLYPGERNTAVFPDGSKAAIQDYCELLETADNTDVLATYGEDFYKGYAVATHHAFGKGHAYYVAARMDADGNAKVFRAAMAQAGCTMQTLPDGVEYHCREDERAVYHFYLNTTETDKTVAVPTGADLLTGKTVSGEVTLGRYGACAVEVVK